MPKFVIILASILTLALLLPAQAAPLGAAINVVNFAFEDAGTALPISLAAGAPVVWTGVSGVHTVTAADGSFDSGLLLPGNTFTLQVPAGVHVYSCVLHPTMRGIVIAA